MALSLPQRADIARQANTNNFGGQIMSALIKHSKWQLGTAVNGNNVTAYTQQLAFSILNSPDSYTIRFAIAIIVAPIFDALVDVSTIADETMQGQVEEHFKMFATPPEPPV